VRNVRPFSGSKNRLQPNTLLMIDSIKIFKMPIDSISILSVQQFTSHGVQKSDRHTFLQLPQFSISPEGISALLTTNLSQVAINRHFFKIVESIQSYKISLAENVFEDLLRAYLYIPLECTEQVLLVSFGYSI